VCIGLLTMRGLYFVQAAKYAAASSPSSPWSVASTASSDASWGTDSAAATASYLVPKTETEFVRVGAVCAVLLVFDSAAFAQAAEFEAPSQESVESVSSQSSTSSWGSGNSSLQAWGLTGSS
jgi:hypothetical protein